MWHCVLMKDTSSLFIYNNYIILINQLLFVFSPKQSSYPKIGLGKRFLCSGGYIGYAPVIYSLMTDHVISDTDDDQLYYTELFLDEEKRVRERKREREREL